MSQTHPERTLRSPRGWKAAALVAVSAALLGPWTPGAARASWIWVEGEKPVRSTMHRHPWWYDKVKVDQLSGGDLISNFHDKAPGEALYRVNAPQAGEYELWVRANPVATRLAYMVNDGKWTDIDTAKDAQGTVNVAEDGKIDLRFLAWVRAGKVALRGGNNSVRFRMDSKNSHHGYLDCFVFTNEPFTPNGAIRPDQAATAARRASAEDRGWFAFAPAADRYSPTSGIDLRSLNEKEAGDGGFIGVRGSRFVHEKTGRPVRFWAVNGPPGRDREALRRDARVLAKRGVNLVRLHHPYYDKNGALDPAEVRHAIEVVEAMKAEGIYTHISIYFPLWLQPAPDTPWLRGYDGRKNPFAALFFNKDFQAKYRSWWVAVLTTPNPRTGKTLIDEPALAGAELVNEDSYFFWTFDAKTIPDAQLRIVETQYGDWLKARHGSIAEAVRRWGGVSDPRDRPAEGRLGFRPLWNVANEKTQRDKDAVRFLAESQRGFYAAMEKFLRGLGYKGLITASNWATASPQVLGPVEKSTYTACDFIDRHGYFGCHDEGPDAAWAIKEGQTYLDRSALRFDPETPGGAKQFVHPAMDPSYDGKPSMISETTWNRPNRFRSEAPLFYAAYGALQGSDAVVHFAMDTTSWAVKPGYFMQPWTLTSPAMMGQFPAAALIYRKGLVAEGDTLVDLNLKLPDLFDLQGTPLPQDAAFDELRLKDVPKGLSLRPGNVIDPLVHFAGRTNVSFSSRGGPPVLKDLKPFIDRARQTVVSTNGQVRLDYGKGVLTLNAPSAQGVSGALDRAGAVDLKDLTMTSGMRLGHIVAVSLDDRPLATSRRVLLQVMSEEKPTDFQTQGAPNEHQRIVSIGRDPWLVKELEGAVRWKRPDAGSLQVSALDGNGDPVETVGTAKEIKLRPTTLYYLIEPTRGSGALKAPSSG